MRSFMFDQGLRGFARPALAGLALLAVLSGPTRSAWAAEAPLTAAETAETVEFVAARFQSDYVFEDRARTIAAHLRRRLKAGAYRNLSREALAALMQQDIRSVDRDRHLEVLAPAPAPPAPSSSGPVDRFGWLHRLRNRNYDFYKVERLPGNVGYLDLRSFPPPEVAGPTAKAAMSFLRHSKAVIIDLTKNGGGTGNMVQLLASYFFVDHVRLIRTFRRAATPQVTEDYTLPFLEGERLPDADLFILVSKDTFSAAEAFAFALQQRGRAVVVGEATKGGANAGRYVDAPNGLRVFIPVAHASSPVTEKSWDETGVVPDIQVPPDRALAEAHREALRRILARTTDETDRKSLSEILAGLEPGK